MLKINDLSKSFGDKIIFEKFSTGFPDHGIFALMGKSGVGKTTLLRLIAGLDKKFDGEIIGGGAKNTSFAFQEYRLFPTLSALENVVFANHHFMTLCAEREAKSMLMRLGFTKDELNLFPSELSGGMKQRVSLARAILRKAPILLLDEPTKELNDELSKKVLDILLEESESRLVIFITHNKSDADYTGASVISFD